MLISLRGFRLSAAVSEKGGGGGETAQSKLEKVLGKLFEMLPGVSTSSWHHTIQVSLLLFEGKWYIFIQGKRAL